MKTFVTLLLLICAGIAHAGTPLTLGQTLSLGDILALTNVASPASFTDDFNRVESPLNNGGAWVTPAASQYASISANGSAAHGDQHDTSPDFSLGQNSARVVSPSFSSNQVAYIVINNTDGPGVGVRLKSDGTGYMLYCYTGSVLILHRLDGTIPFTEIHTFGASLSVGDTIGLSVSNSTFTVYQNGSTVGTWTDSTYSTGDPGIWIYNDSATIDSFWANDL